MNLFQGRRRRTDYVMPVCMLILAVMGVSFIYTSGGYNMAETELYRQTWFKQIIFFTIGAGAYTFIARIDYEKFFIWAHLIYALSILMLVPLVLQEVFNINIPLVKTHGGATRWVYFGLFSVQPSEIAKIGALIMTSAVLARSKVTTVKASLKVLIKLAVIISIPILLIFLQPDLGSTLVFPPMVFAMLYVSKLSKRFFIGAFTAFAVLIAIVAIDIYRYANFLEQNQISVRESIVTNAFGSSRISLPMKDYQRSRILSFVAPDFVDQSGRDVTWNLRQSLISIGSGGVFGKGLGEGTQAKLGYLPSGVADNDFIFAVLAEESGFVGATLAVSLFGVIIIFCCLRAARLSRDRFGQFLCVGVGAILMTHVFINIGMTLGIMPITGLPLPMLSSGGSFVLTCCILLGLVQSVYRHRQIYD